MSGRREHPDPTPVAIPLGFNRPPTLQETIQRLVRQQLSEEASAAGVETFEEADDFDVDEDPDPLSPYEVTEMQQEAIIGKETMDGPPVVPAPAPAAAPDVVAPPAATPPASKT